MEIVTAARLHLLSFPTVRSLVQTRVWKYKPEETIEETGRAGIVLNHRSGWSKPGMNSQEYPILVVECAADHSRDGQGMMVQEDGEARAVALYREIDRVLHQVDREKRIWPANRDDGLVVLGSFRGSEPTEPVDKWGVKVVRVTYDLQVIH